MCDAPWPRRALSPEDARRRSCPHRPWRRCLRVLLRAAAHSRRRRSPALVGASAHRRRCRRRRAPMGGTHSDGAPRWGACANGRGRKSEVGPDVSGRHARLWRDDAGAWWVQGCDSRHGTVLVNGLTGEETVVEPPPRPARWLASLSPYPWPRETNSVSPPPPPSSS